MAIDTSPIGFKSIDSVQEILAEAQNLGGFVINQNYDPEIEDYRRMIPKFWNMIPSSNKKVANSPLVRKLAKTNRTRVGFVDRDDLSAAEANSKVSKDFNDPGQEVKALAATIDFSHFSRSMSAAQNRPYGDEVAEDTDELIQETYRFLDIQLFQADAAQNPNEFNGLPAQMPNNPSHIFEVDLTDSASPEIIHKKVNEIVMRVATNRDTLRQVSHIFCTGAAYVRLQDEVADVKQNVMEIIPGYNVPAIMTGDGQKPIISSPYLDDVADVQNTGDSGTSYDYLRMWLLDMSKLEWRGVPPEGGDGGLEPQIFDVTQYQNGNYLVLKRLLLMYGTPYLKNQALWRLDIKVPFGQAWNYMTP